jgi:membrane-bound lytic murein transglycosylase F
MLSKMLIVLVCTLIASSGCTHLVDGALKKDAADQGSRVQADVVQEDSVAEIDEALIDPSTEALVRLYGPTIKRYAGEYGVDWRLVLATMKQESGFSPTAKSHRGASGLMQIMPVTSEELSRIFNVEDISHPNDNIRGGVYHLRRLYNLYPGAKEKDRIRLTLAAYNAGIGRIADVQQLAEYFHLDPLEWESVRDALPLLSKRHMALHRTVWSRNRPRTGWFRNWGETLKYVENVMNNYDDYRLMFN